MKTTLRRYINNPAIIKGASVNSQIKLVQNDYKQRFDVLMVREAGEFACYRFKDASKDGLYYIKVLVPSENTKGLYYDVVFELESQNPELGEFNMENYNVRFFSNDPAFVFTYAYTFNKSELLIPWLIPKINKMAVTKKPDVRNPRMETGYVKSFYFAYYFLKNRSLLFSDKWTDVPKMNKSVFLRTIANSNSKLDDINRLKEIEKQKKKQELEDKKSGQRSLNKYASDHVKITSMVKGSGKRSKMSKMVKRSKVIGRK